VQYAYIKIEINMLHVLGRLCLNLVSVYVIKAIFITSDVYSW